MGQNITPSTGM